MRYAALYGEFTREPPAATADDATFGAWARLLIYASTLELPVNPEDDLCAGRIPRCHEWGDRTWLHTTGTDRAGVDSVVSAGLARWDTCDLLVDGYDMRGHRAVSANRANGSRGGRPRSSSRNPPVYPSDNPSQNPPVTQQVTQPEPSANPGQTPLPLPSPSPIPEERESAHAHTRETITQSETETASPIVADSSAPISCEIEATSASRVDAWLDQAVPATDLPRSTIIPPANRSGVFVGDRRPLPEEPPNLPPPDSPLFVQLVTMHAEQYLRRHAGVTPMRDYNAAKKVAEWAEANAHAYRMTPKDLGAKLISGLFANPRALDNDCPLSWVAKKPTEFAPPPRAARTMSPARAAPAVSAQDKERQERETRIAFLEQDIQQAQWLQESDRIERLTARLKQERAELEQQKHGRQAAAE